MTKLWVQTKPGSFCMFVRCCHTETKRQTERKQGLMKEKTNTDKHTHTVDKWQDGFNTVI